MTIGDDIHMDLQEFIETITTPNGEVMIIDGLSDLQKEMLAMITEAFRVDAKIVIGNCRRRRLPPKLTAETLAMYAKPNLPTKMKIDPKKKEPYYRKFERKRRKK